MSENKPSVSRGRKFSGVWIIPLLAVAIGAWMVIHTALTEGPTITIDFKTAEGLEAGKTKIRLLSHQIGLVEDVVLKADVSGVTATVKLEPEAKPLVARGYPVLGGPCACGCRWRIGTRDPAFWCLHRNGPRLGGS